MVLSDVDLMLQRSIAQYGIQAFSSVDEKRSVVNRSLKRLTASVHYLWEEKIDIAVAADRAKYPLRTGRHDVTKYFNITYNGVSTGVEVATVEVVYIDSIALRDFSGLPGLVSTYDMDRWVSGWRNELLVSTGEVSKAFIQRDYLVLWQTPTSATVGTLGDHYIRGCYIHPDVDGDTSQGYPIAVPVEYEDLLESLIAETMLKDYQSGGQAETYQRLKKENVEALRAANNAIRSSDSSSSAPSGGGWGISL